MPLSDWKVISWSPFDPLDVDVLDAMVSNSETLKASMMIGFYENSDVTRTDGVRVASGMVQVPAAAAKKRSVTVSFKDFFSDGCKPNVVVTPYTQQLILPTVTGPTGTGIPSTDGFRVTLNLLGEAKKIKTLYVAWAAYGY